MVGLSRLVVLEHVTPFVGVWIEMPSGKARDFDSRIVTPFVGVWIEIKTVTSLDFVPLSLPSWECGLKF